MLPEGVPGDTAARGHGCQGTSVHIALSVWNALAESPVPRWRAQQVYSPALALLCAHYTALSPLCQAAWRGQGLLQVCRSAGTACGNEGMRREAHSL
jgi:hypothetical protein